MQIIPVGHPAPDRHKEHHSDRQGGFFLRVGPSENLSGRASDRQVMRELDEIFRHCESDGFQWICQKYIERPGKLRPTGCHCSSRRRSV